ncbi:MAG: hypothetical protein POH28_16895, partial [Acidocella sp.]|nr:hypothetical protein [Acidocella sp.]
MRITALKPELASAGFHSGVAVLDNYWPHRALRDAARHLAAVFLLHTDTGDLAGFYSLSAGDLVLPDLLGGPRVGASRYPVLPVV